MNEPGDHRPPINEILNSGHCLGGLEYLFSIANGAFMGACNTVGGIQERNTEPKAREPPVAVVCPEKAYDDGASMTNIPLYMC